MPLDSATSTFKVPTFDLTPAGKAQTAKTDKSSLADGADQATGSGSLGQTGAAPDPHGAKAAVVLTALTMALGSLEVMMPGGHDSSDDLEVELAAVIAKLKKTTDDVDKGKLKTDAEQKEAAIKQQKDALDKAAQQSQKAAESAKHVSLADKFKAAFAWIGAIVAVVVAVVLIATGVGAAAGVALLAAAVIGIAMAADQTVQLANQASGKHGGMGMFGMMFEDIGKSLGMSGDKLAAFTEKATMGLNMALMVASIALSFVNPEAAEGAVAEAAEMGENVANLGADATKFQTIEAHVKDFVIATVNDLKGSISDLVGEARTFGENALQKLEKIGNKIESLAKDLKNMSASELKGKLADLLDELKDAAETAVKALRDKAARGVERAYVEVRSSVEDLIGGVLHEGQRFLNEGGKGYAHSKLTEALEKFKDNFRVKDEFGKVTEEKKFSRFETAKYARETNESLRDKGDTVLDAVSSVQRSQAKALTGESDMSKADAKVAEALEKLLSAAIDMVLMQMKKHGEAFDAQIDQIMDGMRSHQNSLTRHVA